MQVSDVTCRLATERACSSAWLEDGSSCRELELEPSHTRTMLEPAELEPSATSRVLELKPTTDELEPTMLELEPTEPKLEPSAGLASSLAALALGWWSSSST